MYMLLVSSEVHANSQVHGTSKITVYFVKTIINGFEDDGKFPLS